MTKSSAADDPERIADAAHPSARSDDRLLRDCSVRRQRRSGPGGQHRNKVSTAVVITHLPTGIRGEASERRSQDENHRRALFRLRVNLALQIRTPAGTGASAELPSELWRRRCRGGRIAVNPAHADFPALLAEALDAITRASLEVRPAADWLGCTPTQLIRFLQLEPRAIELINRARTAAGKANYK